MSSHEQVAHVMATMTPEDIAAEMLSWQTLGHRMNRKLLRIMDVLEEMERVDPGNEYAARINHILGDR
jgi:hypothetical protein